MSGMALGRMIDVPWLTDGTYEFGYVDYIFSMLIDSPGDFYITPNEQVVFVYIAKRGLIRFVHDFRNMNDYQINRVIGLLLQARGY